MRHIIALAAIVAGLFVALPAPASASPPPPGTTWPTPTGTVTLTGSIRVSGTFDGGMRKYCCPGGNADATYPLFWLEAGATLQNVILGPGAGGGGGVHCAGSCTLRNVWFDGVELKGATFAGTTGATSYVIGGGARNADEVVFQHNGNGTVNISGFSATNIVRLYRACVNCTTAYSRHSRIDNVILTGVRYVSSINTNFADTTTITRLTLVGSADAHVCARYRGVPKGSVPAYLGDGWNDANCKVKRSDVTYR